MFEKVFVITRKTRLAELVERFNTVGQARFYIEHAGGDFEEYEREDVVYRKAVEETRRSLPSEIKVHALDRSQVPTVLFSERDLIITLGQDGVVANTAKYVKGQPIIAVNPDPERFDGILMPFLPSDVRDAIAAVLGGREHMREVTMAEARLQDGQRILAFNDLFIGASSHVSARYKITLQGRLNISRRAASLCRLERAAPVGFRRSSIWQAVSRRRWAAHPSNGFTWIGKIRVCSLWRGSPSSVGIRLLIW